MREMRLKKREVKDVSQLKTILEECKVVRVGGSDEEGMFIFPVNFGFELTGDGQKPKLKLYFHSSSQGRKADAFRKNHQVAFEMDCGHSLITGDYSCVYSYAYQSIMGTGSIRLALGKEEKLHGLRLLMEHMKASHMQEFKEAALERVNVYCIEAEAFTGKMRMPD